MHLRNVHRIGQDGQLMDPAEQEQKLRIAFGNSLPRITFNINYFRIILIHWMVVCNIPFKGIEHQGFRLLLSYLAACV
jgi:hypothetical protein